MNRLESEIKSAGILKKAKSSQGIRGARLLSLNVFYCINFQLKNPNRRASASLPESI